MLALPRARVRLRAAGSPAGGAARRRGVPDKLGDGIRQPRFDPHAGPESEGGGGRDVGTGVTDVPRPRGSPCVAERTIHRALHIGLGSQVNDRMDQSDRFRDRGQRHDKPSASSASTKKKRSFAECAARFCMRPLLLRLSITARHGHR